jgi:hypothetical protein
MGQKKEFITMNRKEITAHLIGCESSDFMAYADLGDDGTVVVGPDGKKFRFPVAELERIDKKIKAKSKSAPKPKRKAAKKPGTVPKTAE